MGLRIKRILTQLIILRFSHANAPWLLFIQDLWLSFQRNTGYIYRTFPNTSSSLSSANGLIFPTPFYDTMQTWLFLTQDNNILTKPQMRWIICHEGV